MLTFLKKKIYIFIYNSQKRSIIKKKNKCHKIELVKKNYFDLQFFNFGKKNKDKIFYIIQRKKGGGFFSNLIYVINHLIIADKLKFIPFVDMENFETYYSEKNKINNTYNSWEYYFKQVSSYSAKEIYSSKNVIISSNEFKKNFYQRFDPNNKNIKKIFNKYIFINNKFKNIISNFIQKNNINKDTTLGVHWRGTDHKFLPNHPSPPNKKQITEKVDFLLKKFNFKNIFLITEDPLYLQIMKKKYKNKIKFYNSFRSSKTKDFSTFNRKNHRYLLGVESLCEALTMSNLTNIVCSESHISDFAIFKSDYLKYNIYRIYNGRNSKSLFLNFLKFKIQCFLPSFFWGYK